MPIPLGILAAAGVRAAGGSYELIETITVGSGGAASVTFSNLNTYSSTYQHLQIRAVTRLNFNGGERSIGMRINGDSGNNYATHELRGEGSSVASGGGASANAMNCGSSPAATATGSVFGAHVIDLLDVYETKNKTIRTLAGNPALPQISLRSGVWLNTASVTSITIGEFFSNSSFVQGSRFSIYGLKAS